MPKFNISKSIHIDATPEKVFSVLNDFNTWVTWSPWLIMDPDTKVNIANDNKSYDWNGGRTGSGDMKILSETPSSKITYDLNFLKPWKSNAKVSFEVEKVNGGSKVSWLMNSSLPFFMFFMKKMMTAFVGNDYKRGLLLLKDYVEDGKVHSKLNFIGQQEFPGVKFIGIKRTCSMNDMPKEMEVDMKTLAGKGSVEEAFVQYETWNFVKGICTYVAAIPVQEIPLDLSSELISGEIPRCKIYTLEHIGPYRHLGNAWTTMYSMERGKEFKVRKDIHPFETYGNNPASTDEKELITHINFAVK